MLNENKNDSFIARYFSNGTAMPLVTGRFAVRCGVQFVMQFVTYLRAHKDRRA